MTSRAGTHPLVMKVTKRQMDLLGYTVDTLAKQFAHPKAADNINAWLKGRYPPGTTFRSDYLRILKVKDNEIEPARRNLINPKTFDDKIIPEVEEKVIVNEPKLISSFVMEKYSGESAARIELKSNDDDFMAFVQRVHEKTKGLIETKFVHAEASDFETKPFDLGTKETTIPKPGPEVYPKKGR